ncbi:hypothetical protein EDD99_5146 [Streptomyces sp. 846.5]|nr:hypothetical protein [Streptomyces sp. 846.5]TDU06584.1 hypothetical protein EDD99_5146 [Streptomyces sp. 846.5]
MTNITSQTTAALSRSWRRVARPRRWLLQLSAAGSGCALLAAGDRPPGGILLVLGLTLPVWRAPERDEHPAQRFRSRHRRIAARAGLLPVTAVIAVPHLSPLLLLLAPLPSLLEPYVWLAWPAGLRRTARVARASEAVREAWGYTSSPPAFDPDQGAAGRIEPLLAHPGGEPSKRSVKRATRPPGKVMTLRDGFRWDGAHLYYGDRARFRVLRLAPPGPGRPGPAAAPLPRRPTPPDPPSGHRDRPVQREHHRQPRLSASVVRQQQRPAPERRRLPAAPPDVRPAARDGNGADRPGRETALRRVRLREQQTTASSR